MTSHKISYTTFFLSILLLLSFMITSSALPPRDSTSPTGIGKQRSTRRPAPLPPRRRRPAPLPPHRRYPRPAPLPRRGYPTRYPRLTESDRRILELRRQLRAYGLTRRRRSILLDLLSYYLRRRTLDRYGRLYNQQHYSSVFSPMAFEQKDHLNLYSNSWSKNREKKSTFTMTGNFNGKTQHDNLFGIQSNEGFSMGDRPSEVEEMIYSSKDSKKDNGKSDQRNTFKKMSFQGDVLDESLQKTGDSVNSVFMMSQPMQWLKYILLKYESNFNFEGVFELKKNPKEKNDKQSEVELFSEAYKRVRRGVTKYMKIHETVYNQQCIFCIMKNHTNAIENILSKSKATEFKDRKKDNVAQKHREFLQDIEFGIVLSNDNMLDIYWQDSHSIQTKKRYTPSDIDKKQHDNNNNDDDDDVLSVDPISRFRIPDEWVGIGNCKQGIHNHGSHKDCNIKSGKKIHVKVTYKSYQSKRMFLIIEIGKYYRLVDPSQLMFHDEVSTEHTWNANKDQWNINPFFGKKGVSDEIVHAYFAKQYGKKLEKYYKHNNKPMDVQDGKPDLSNWDKDSFIFIGNSFEHFHNLENIHFVSDGVEVHVDRVHLGTIQEVDIKSNDNHLHDDTDHPSMVSPVDIETFRHNIGYDIAYEFISGKKKKHDEKKECDDRIKCECPKCLIGGFVHKKKYVYVDRCYNKNEYLALSDKTGYFGKCKPNDEGSSKCNGRGYCKCTPDIEIPPPVPETNNTLPNTTTIPPSSHCPRGYHHGGKCYKKMKRKPKKPDPSCYVPIHLSYANTLDSVVPLKDCSIDITGLKYNTESFCNIEEPSQYNQTTTNNHHSCCSIAELYQSKLNQLLTAYNGTLQKDVHYRIHDNFQQKVKTCGNETSALRHDMYLMPGEHSLVHQVIIEIFNCTNALPVLPKEKCCSFRDKKKTQKYLDKCTGNGNQMLIWNEIDVSLKCKPYWNRDAYQDNCPLSNAPPTYDVLQMKIKKHHHDHHGLIMPNSYELLNQQFVAPFVYTNDWLLKAFVIGPQAPLTQEIVHYSLSGYSNVFDPYVLHLFNNLHPYYNSDNYEGDRLPTTQDLPYFKHQNDFIMQVSKANTLEDVLNGTQGLLIPIVRMYPISMITGFNGGFHPISYYQQDKYYLDYVQPDPVRQLALEKTVHLHILQYNPSEPKRTSLPKVFYEFNRAFCYETCLTNVFSTTTPFNRKCPFPDYYVDQTKNLKDWNLLETQHFYFGMEFGNGVSGHGSIHMNIHYQGDDTYEERYGNQEMIADDIFSVDNFKWNEKNMLRHSNEVEVNFDAIHQKYSVETSWANCRRRLLFGPLRIQQCITLEVLSSSGLNEWKLFDSKTNKYNVDADQEGTFNVSTTSVVLSTNAPDVHQHKVLRFCVQKDGQLALVNDDSTPATNQTTIDVMTTDTEFDIIRELFRPINNETVRSPSYKCNKNKSEEDSKNSFNPLHLDPYLDHRNIGKVNTNKYYYKRLENCTESPYCNRTSYLNSTCVYDSCGSCNGNNTNCGLFDPHECPPDVLVDSNCILDESYCFVKGPVSMNETMSINEDKPKHTLDQILDWEYDVGGSILLNKYAFNESRIEFQWKCINESVSDQINDMYPLQIDLDQYDGIFNFNENGELSFTDYGLSWKNNSEQWCQQGEPSHNGTSDHHPFAHRFFCGDDNTSINGTCNTNGRYFHLKVTQRISMKWVYMCRSGMNTSHICVENIEEEIKSLKANIDIEVYNRQRKASLAHGKTSGGPQCKCEKNNRRKCWCLIQRYRRAFKTPCSITIDTIIKKCKDPSKCSENGCEKPTMHELYYMNKHNYTNFREGWLSVVDFTAGHPELCMQTKNLRKVFRQDDVFIVFETCHLVHDYDVHTNTNFTLDLKSISIQYQNGPVLQLLNGGVAPFLNPPPRYIYRTMPIHHHHHHSGNHTSEMRQFKCYTWKLKTVGHYFNFNHHLMNNLLVKFDFEKIFKVYDPEEDEWEIIKKPLTLKSNLKIRLRHKLRANVVKNPVIILEKKEIIWRPPRINDYKLNMCFFKDRQLKRPTRNFVRNTRVWMVLNLLSGHSEHVFQNMTPGQIQQHLHQHHYQHQCGHNSNGTTNNSCLIERTCGNKRMTLLKIHKVDICIPRINYKIGNHYNPFSYHKRKVQCNNRNGNIWTILDLTQPYPWFGGNLWKTKIYYPRKCPTKVIISFIIRKPCDQFYRAPIHAIVSYDPISVLIGGRGPMSQWKLFKGLRPSNRRHRHHHHHHTLQNNQMMLPFKHYITHHPQLDRYTESFIDIMKHRSENKNAMEKSMKLPEQFSFTKNQKWVSRISKFSGDVSLKKFNNIIHTFNPVQMIYHRFFEQSMLNMDCDNDEYLDERFCMCCLPTKNKIINWIIQKFEFPLVILCILFVLSICFYVYMCIAGCHHYHSKDHCEESCSDSDSDSDPDVEFVTVCKKKKINCNTPKVITNDYPEELIPIVSSKEFVHELSLENHNRAMYGFGDNIEFEESTSLRRK